MSRRLALLLVLLAAPAFGGGVARAQDRSGLQLDPRGLPAGAWPGACVVRRVTGPGGAYRWDRMECDGHGGWSDLDRWGDERRLDVETGPPGGLAADRHGPGDGHGQDWEQAYRRYSVAGVDENGWLVWPGKQP